MKHKSEICGMRRIHIGLLHDLKLSNFYFLGSNDNNADMYKIKHYYPLPHFSELSQNGLDVI